jgi:hypothetical protein
LEFGKLRTSTLDVEKDIAQNVVWVGLNGTEIDVKLPPSFVLKLASV